MIGYLLPGATAESCAEDVRMRRLIGAGPWKYQSRGDAGFASWDGAARPISGYGTPRETLDKLTYYPPLELPMPSSLVRPQMTGRDDVHWIDVETLDALYRLPILPAYLSPRKILEGGKLGDAATLYGKLSRMLNERISANPDLLVSEIRKDLYDVCVAALMHTMRVTPELIQDYGWLNQQSCWQIWECVLRVPKESPASGGEPSASSSPAAPPPAT